MYCAVLRMHFNVDNSFTAGFPQIRTRESYECRPSLVGIIDLSIYLPR